MKKVLYVLAMSMMIGGAFTGAASAEDLGLRPPMQIAALDPEEIRQQIEQQKKGQVAQNSEADAEDEEGGADIEGSATVEIQSSAFQRLYQNYSFTGSFSGLGDKTYLNRVDSGGLNFDFSLSFLKQPKKEGFFRDFGFSGFVGVVFSHDYNLEKNLGIDSNVTGFTALGGVYTVLEPFKDVMWQGTFRAGFNLVDRNGLRGTLLSHESKVVFSPTKTPENLYNARNIYGPVEYNALLLARIGNSQDAMFYARHDLQFFLGQHYIGFGPQVSFLMYDVNGPNFEGWDVGGVVRIRDFDRTSSYEYGIKGTFTYGPNRDGTAEVSLYLVSF